MTINAVSAVTAVAKARAVRSRLVLNPAILGGSNGVAGGSFASMAQNSSPRPAGTTIIFARLSLQGILFQQRHRAARMAEHREPFTHTSPAGAGLANIVAPPAVPAQAPRPF